jgi:hypothetical protein
MAIPSSEQTQCRLCGGNLAFKFSLLILHKHNVRYYECATCKSLQTEQPYWLHEAYELNLSNLDTGAVQRNLQNVAASIVVSKLFNANDVIDFGGGDGLLCRLLRDYNINCFVSDKHAVPTYGQGFSCPDFAVPKLVTAFEVVEHFAEPLQELAPLFDKHPKAVLIGTFVYVNRSHDWWYLAAESGQHVFFYSPDAIRWVADRYGYSSMLVGNYALFAQPALLTPFKRMLLLLLLNPIVCRLLRGIALVMPAPGAQRDHLAAKKKTEGQ